MALLASEGFGLSSAIADFLTYGAFSQQRSCSIATGGPSGDNYLSVSGNNGCALRQIPGLPTTAFIGMKLNLLTAGSNGAVVQLISGGGSTSGAQIQLLLVFKSTSVTVYRGQNVANLGSATIALANNTWYEVEIQATISLTVGVVVVRINGSTVLSLSGVNTENDTGNPNLGFVELGSVNVVCDAAGYGHVYVCDNTGAAPWNGFLGDVRVQTLLPTANGTVTFTPNGAATNWQNAAEVPPVPGTDFNQSSAVGNQDTFSHGAMETNNGLVFGVNVKSILLDGGVSTTMTDVLVSGASTLDGPTVTPGTAALQYPAMTQTDPGVSGQWQAAAVNAATFGYKRLT